MTESLYTLVKCEQVYQKQVSSDGNVHFNVDIVPSTVRKLF